MENFNLKKFLVENKLTTNSKATNEEKGVQLSDPELAVRWWSRREPSEKQELLDKYLPQHKSDRMSSQDIYWLWLKQQKL